ncbi:MAG: 1-acyl-sn-glycerol-3-phosphate acyltransferase [Clostridiales bacterium]|jgi:1-acyl-sn-glycerol-3-phosphate acyltransferase|nr:1-acyl-sn-glycerol-3-phosphate acyltransferase [Clostridiales bacterium]
MLYFVFVVLIGPIVLLLWPTRVINKKNRPKRGAVICCNHYSLPDPLIVGMHILRRLRYVIKKEFAKNIFGKFFVWGIGSVTVDRGKADLKALRKMLNLLKAGKALMMFPEGHRNRGGEDGGMLELRNGAVMLAAKTRVPIVPAAFLKKPRYFRRNYLAYGEPLEFPELYGVPLTKDKLDAASRRLAESMERLKKTEVGK